MQNNDLPKTKQNLENLRDINKNLQFRNIDPKCDTDYIIKKYKYNYDKTQDNKNNMDIINKKITDECVKIISDNVYSDNSNSDDYNSE